MRERVRLQNGGLTLTMTKRKPKHTVILGTKEYDTTDPKQLWTYWSTLANNALKGKKIVGCRYLHKEETKSFHWYKASLVIELDDGSCLIAQMDDMGSDGGCIVHLHKDGSEELFPTL